VVPLGLYVRVEEEITHDGFLSLSYIHNYHPTPRDLFNFDVSATEVISLRSKWEDVNVRICTNLLWPISRHLKDVRLERM
jgi:hypothetical protein